MSWSRGSLVLAAGLSACSTGGAPSAYNAGETILVMAHADDTPEERHKWYDSRRALFRKDCTSGFTSACRRIKEIDAEEREYFHQVDSLGH